MTRMKVSGIEKIAAALAVVSFAFAGIAQAEPDYDQNGFYLGGGLGLGFPQYTGLPSTDWDTGLGFDAWGGYRFMPNFAVETQLEYLARMDAEIPGPDIEGQQIAWSTNLKLYLLTGRFQPFAYGGIGLGWVKQEMGSSDSSDVGFLARLGGGVDFYLLENLALQVNAAYVRPTGKLDSYDYVSLLFGAQYRF